MGTIAYTATLTNDKKVSKEYTLDRLPEPILDGMRLKNLSLFINCSSAEELEKLIKFLSVSKHCFNHQTQNKAI